MKSKLLLPAAAVIITAAVSFGLNALAATFAEPSSAPPSNNAYAPLDTSPNTNIKPGIIGVNGFTVYSSTVLAADSGNVGVGTYSPSQKLDVAGNAQVSGSINGGSLCMNGDCRSSWGTPIYYCPNINSAGNIDAGASGYGSSCWSSCVGNLSTNSTCKYNEWDTSGNGGDSAGCAAYPTTVTCTPLGHLVQ